MRQVYQYPTDWNDAMFAAEKFGLFDNMGHRRQLWRAHGDGEPTQWNVAPFDLNEALHGAYVSAPTGPLAICRAILKLANRDA